MKFSALPDEAIERITSFLAPADLCNAAMANQALADVTADQRLNAKADEFRRKKLMQKAFRLVRRVYEDHKMERAIEPAEIAYILDDEARLFDYFFGLV